MKKIAAIFFWIFFYVAVSFSCNTIAFAVEIMCTQPKASIVALPLSFSSVPTIPEQLTIGVASEFVYTVQNNTTSLTMEILPSLPGAGGEASIIPSTSNDCSLGDLTPSGTCNITVEIEPTTLGPASYALAVNYMVSEEASCFNDITSDIEYEAISSGGDTYAYVTNKGGNSVTYCNVDFDGTLNDCTDSGAENTFVVPGTIVIPSMTFSGETYAYVSNSGAGRISQCHINTSTGAFTGPCDDSGASNIFGQPFGIAFESIESTLYSYVANAASGNISQCTVDTSDGKFGDCGVGAQPFFTPDSIAIQTVSGTDYAYVINRDLGTISQCQINVASGRLMLCKDSGAGNIFGGPTDITFFTSTDLHAYVSTLGIPGMWFCNVDSSSGALMDCADMEIGVDSILSIGFGTISGTNYAYLTDPLNNVTICTVTAGPVNDGQFESCSFNTSLASSEQVFGITHQTFNSIDYIYVAALSGGSVWQCRVGNDLSASLYCIDSGAGVAFATPASVAFQANADTNVYAYVTDPTLGQVSACLVNSTTGQLSGCTNTGAAFTAPYYVTFATVNAILYAYITDGGDGTVYQCGVDFGGGLSNCTDAGSTISPPYVQPAGLFYQNFGGIDYLYVSDLLNNSVYQCTVDASMGLFTACVDLSVTPLNKPGFFTIETVDSSLYAYIPNSDTTAVSPVLTRCTVDNSSGAFLDCTTFSFPEAQNGVAFFFSEPYLHMYATLTDGITGEITQCYTELDGSFSTCTGALGSAQSVAMEEVNTGSDLVGYFVETSGGGVLRCLVDPTNGTINGRTPCEDAGAGFTFVTPTDIFLQEISGNTFAYVTDSTLNTVTQCAVNPTDGVLSSCLDSGAGDIFTDAISISFDTVSGDIYAYVLSESNNSSTQCGVNDTTGLFDSCQSTSNFFVQPIDLAFNDNFAYVTDLMGNMVYFCQKQSDGTLTACMDSGATALTGPAGIQFFTDGDGDIHAYINNIGSTTVTYCAVDPGPGFSTGRLTSCSGVGGAFTQPATTGFQTFGFTTSYGYVTNSSSSDNSVSLCTVNADGTFNICGDSGAGSSIFNQPSGIAFYNP